MKGLPILLALVLLAPMATACEPGCAVESEGLTSYTLKCDDMTVLTTGQDPSTSDEGRAYALA